MTNPYAAPAAAFDGAALFDTDSYKPVLFELNGRIGRLRFLGYSWVLGFLLQVLVVGLVAAHAYQAAALLQPWGNFVVLAFVARRRLHDLDRSAWFALAMLIPFLNILVGLYLLCAPGTDGVNRFGRPPQPNGRGGIVVMLLAAVIVIGILAAVAIPAYQNYVLKARAAQTQQH
ncbi:MAG: DUF805 domain-containing protein [Telluria sp.]